jgi:hypothetical protein
MREGRKEGRREGGREGRKEGRKEENDKKRKKDPVGCRSLRRSFNLRHNVGSELDSGTANVDWRKIGVKFE